MKRRIKENGWKLAALAALLCAGLSLWAFFIWQREIGQALADFGNFLSGGTRVLSDAPLPLYALAVFLLPMFFLPVSFIFIIAGNKVAVEQCGFWEIYFWCALGQCANIFASYFIAAKFGGFVRSLLERKKIRLLDIPKDDEAEIILLVRLIPGNPLAVQNYLLGLARVGFRKYAFFSLLVQLPTVLAYMYFGEHLFSGNLGGTLTGLSILIVIALGARLIGKRRAHRI